jgi:hypothetical protein
MHYLLILRRRSTSSTCYIVCVLCQLAATKIGVELTNSTPILVQPLDINTYVIYQVPLV